MTTSQAAAIIIAEAVALVVGYLARPAIDGLRAERRFRLHVAACSACRPVHASNGPLWLYCGEARSHVMDRETPEVFEARARQRLREAMDAVPMTRGRDGN